MKFEIQSIDPVKVDDLLNEAFGRVPSKAARRHGMYKSFFGCQYQQLLHTSNKTHPKFNIEAFLKHPLVSFKSMWDLG